MLYSYFDPKKIYESCSISGSSIVSNNNLIGIYSLDKNLCIYYKQPGPDIWHPHLHVFKGHATWVITKSVCHLKYVLLF